MNLPNATIVVSVNEKFKPYLNLLNENLKKSGARFELFIITNVKDLDVSFLKPNKKYVCQDEEGSEYLNEVIRKPNNCLVLISEPFLCQSNWLKKLIEFKDNLHSCGSVILPFHSYIQDFELTHTLNNEFELSDVYALPKPKYCGITLIGQEAINLIGAFNSELDFDSAIVEYIYRLKKLGIENFVSFEFATNIFEKKHLNEFDLSNLQIERAIRSFSPIEEIAYNNLDSWFQKANLQAEKFMFEFTATFGFRCMCLNSYQLQLLQQFSLHYNLTFEIKSHFLSSEQRLQKNTYVIFTFLG